MVNYCREGGDVRAVHKTTRFSTTMPLATHNQAVLREFEVHTTTAIRSIAKSGPLT